VRRNRADGQRARVREHRRPAVSWRNGGLREYNEDLAVHA
jgi:hypothetical protein